MLPISILGERDIWKNVQKKEKKNKISDTINKIIPNRINIVTLIVWNPWKVLSRITSRHHCNRIKIIIKNLYINKFVEKLKNHIDLPISINIKLIDNIKGQGLLVTKWNGCLYP